MKLSQQWKRLVAVALFVTCGVAVANAGQVKIGMTPKFTGVDYFIACENGAKKAAADLGVTLDWQGDPSGQESVAKQQACIQTFIDKGYDAIILSALDPSSFAPTLRQAMAEGIKVVTFDADVVPNARDAFVNGTTEDEMAIAMFKGLLEEQPAGGVLAIISSDPNASNQNARIEAINKAYNAHKDTLYKNFSFYPNIIYAGNNQAEADTKVNTLMTQESNLVGVFALSSMAGPAAGKACRDLGKPIGSISIQTISVPVSSIDDMESGLIKSVVLWQPYDLGYLAVEYAKGLVEGKIDKNAKTYASSLSGKIKIGNEKYESAHKVLDDNVVILSSAILFNLDNVGEFRGYPDATSGIK
ncbi:MAG: substrate-binding domain-containing protein [Planctomycetota bacterium]|jgi:rhamnose transport system substrate-binding protein|nr:substrate-binding domain-containing protein [Planctomycetota bacterium]